MNDCVLRFVLTSQVSTLLST